MECQTVYTVHVQVMHTVNSECSVGVGVCVWRLHSWNVNGDLCGAYSVTRFSRYSAWNETLTVYYRTLYYKKFILDLRLGQYVF